MSNSPPAANWCCATTGRSDAFKSKFSTGHRMMVEFTSEDVEVADPRLRVIHREGPRTWFAFRSEEISPAEAATIIARNHDIRDLTLNEPEIEEIVREFYERQQR